MKNSQLTLQYLSIVSFHEKFQLPQFKSLIDMPTDLVQFREKFLVEEAKETYEAFARKDRHETLDGLVDLTYVAMGTYFLAGGTQDRVARHTEHSFSFLDLYKVSSGYTLSLDPDFVELNKLLDICCGCRKMALDYGFSFHIAFDRVHKANMSKIRAKSNKEGKRGSTWDVVKPEGWVAPDLTDLV